MEEEALLPWKGRGHALGLHLETQAESGGSHSREGVCLGEARLLPTSPPARKEVGGRERRPSSRTSDQTGGSCASPVRRALRRAAAPCGSLISCHKTGALSLPSAVRAGT